VARGLGEKYPVSDVQQKVLLQIFPMQRQQYISSFTITYIYERVGWNCRSRHWRKMKKWGWTMQKWTLTKLYVVN